MVSYGCWVGLEDVSLRYAVNSDVTKRFGHVGSTWLSSARCCAPAPAMPRFRRPALCDAPSREPFARPSRGRQPRPTSLSTARGPTTRKHARLRDPFIFPDGPVGAPQREGRGSLGRTFREPRMRKNIARGGRERGIRPSHAKLATHELASYRDRRTRLGSARTRSCGGTCRGSRTQPPSGSLEADSSRGEIAIEDRV